MSKAERLRPHLGGGGRGHQRSFPLLPSFSGCNDVYHVLSRKQKTPLLKDLPPRHPGKRPPGGGTEEEVKAFQFWKKRADDFASYYLTLFRPHRLDSPHLSYDWEALQLWIEDLRKDKSIISKFRLMVLHQHVRGLRTRAVCKRMARDYRGRARRMWSDAEKDEHRWRVKARNHLVKQANSAAMDDYYTYGAKQLSD